MKKLLNNQSGFMILYLMTLSIVTTAAVLYSFKKNESLTRVVKTNKYKSEIQYLSSNAMRWLSKGNVCTEMLNTVDFSVANPYQSLAQLSSAESGSVIVKGQNYGSGGELTLSNIIIEKFPTLPSGAHRGELRLQFQINDAKVLGGNTIVRTIPLAFELDAAGNVVQNCFSNNDGLADAIEKFCNGGNTDPNVGGAYFDPITMKCTVKKLEKDLSCGSTKIPAGLQYNAPTSTYSVLCADPTPESLKGSCNADEIPFGVDAAGNVKCRNIAATDIEQLISSSYVDCYSGEMKIDVSGSKLKVSCNGSTTTPPPDLIDIGSDPTDDPTLPGDGLGIPGVWSTVTCDDAAYGGPSNVDTYYWVIGTEDNFSGSEWSAHKPTQPVFDAWKTFKSPGQSPKQFDTGGIDKYVSAEVDLSEYKDDIICMAAQVKGQGTGVSTDSFGAYTIPRGTSTPVSNYTVSIPYYYSKGVNMSSFVYSSGSVFATTLDLTNLPVKTDSFSNTYNMIQAVNYHGNLLLQYQDDANIDYFVLSIKVKNGTGIGSSTYGLSFANQPPATTSAGTVWSQQPAVNVIDGSGNILTTDNSTDIGLEAYTTSDCSGAPLTSPMGLVGTTVQSTVNGGVTYSGLSFSSGVVSAGTYVYLKAFSLNNPTIATKCSDPMIVTDPAAPSGSCYVDLTSTDVGIATDGSEEFTGYGSVSGASCNLNYLGFAGTKETYFPIADRTAKISIGFKDNEAAVGSNVCDNATTTNDQVMDVVYGNIYTESGTDAYKMYCGIKCRITPRLSSPRSAQATVVCETIDYTKGSTLAACSTSTSLNISNFVLNTAQEIEFQRSGNNISASIVDPGTGIATTIIPASTTLGCLDDGNYNMLGVKFERRNTISGRAFIESGSPTITTP
ncbi:MAG: hypothetical protein H6621_05785 [Halobacteriovoraceae bacterium]|nr:hypothetical protein [Halobacteriovoraceae bacterium]